MSLKKYIIYFISYILLLILIVHSFKSTFNITDEMDAVEKVNSIHLAVDIIINNFKNFCFYIFLFPIMPLFFLLDLVSTSWAIFVSIETNGMGQTLSKLLPHGIIELPNYILYTYISFVFMKNFYMNFKDAFSIKFVLKYWKYLVLNVILIIVAGLVEGLIT